MMSTTPGPSSIDRHLAPGGIVLHVYDITTNTRLLERALLPGMTVGDIYAAAEADQAELELKTEARQVFVVFYDGDTGKRITPLEAIEHLAP